MRQTIVDIARAARVSTATVDRVLNERPGVRGADPRPRARGGARARLPARGRARRRPAGRCGWTSSCRAVPTPSWICWPSIWRACGAARAAAGRCCVCTASTGSAPRHWPRPARAARRQRRDRHHRPRPPGGARGDPRDRSRRDAGADHGLRHRARAAHRLCRHRQPRRGTARRPSARPLRAGIGRRGGAVRGLAQLSRPRGARDGLSPHPRRRVPEAADRRAARGPRRTRAQLPRGPAPAGGTTRACAGSTISAPATAASPARWTKRAVAARWCSSATS